MVSICGFEVCSCVLNFIAIGQYTIDLSESNQSVHSFLSFTASVELVFILTAQEIECQTQLKVRISGII